jgi:hypothetical protein
MNTENFCVEYVPSFWEKIGYRIWPRSSAYHGMIEDSYCFLEKSEWTQGDVIICNLTTELSLLDRMRVLFGGTIGINLRIVCQNKPGELKTFCVVQPIAHNSKA